MGRGVLPAKFRPFLRLCLRAATFSFPGKKEQDEDGRGCKKNSMGEVGVGVGGGLRRMAPLTPCWFLIPRLGVVQV